MTLFSSSQAHSAFRRTFLRNKKKLIFKRLLCLSVIMLGPTKAHSKANNQLSSNPAVPMIEAAFETDPIPFGERETDDAVVWVHPKNPALSLILGTSKFEADPNGYGGLGIYSLDGHERQFMPGDRLNNIDIPLGAQNTCDANRALASNRSLKSVSVFEVASDEVRKIRDLQVTDDQGKPVKVYGLCSAQVTGADGKPQTLVLLPTKSGVAYLYEVKNITATPEEMSLLKIKTIDLKSFLSAEEDQWIATIVEKSARAQGEQDELEKKLKDRFALEGCAYDHGHGRWLVGMENFGIWSVPEKVAGTRGKPHVLIPVQGSWADVDEWSQNGSKARITDDLEGVDIFSFNQVDYAMFSIQGISEIGLYNLTEEKYIGSFKIRFGADDPVLMTDGVTVKSTPLGARFPQGVVVLHDDQNEAPNGKIDRANYKIIDLATIMSTMLQR